MHFGDDGLPDRYPEKEKRNILLALGICTALAGLILLLWFLWEITPERQIVGGTPSVMEVRVVEDRTDPAPTETPIICQPLLQAGTVCKWEYTPTPMGNCPPISDRMLCIYTGVDDFIPTPSGAVATMPYVS